MIAMERAAATVERAMSLQRIVAVIGCILMVAGVIVFFGGIHQIPSTTPVDFPEDDPQSILWGYLIGSILGGSGFISVAIISIRPPA